VRQQLAKIAFSVLIFAAVIWLLLGVVAWFPAARIHVARLERLVTDPPARIFEDLGRSREVNVALVPPILTSRGVLLAYILPALAALLVLDFLRRRVLDHAPFGAAPPPSFTRPPDAGAVPPGRNLVLCCDGTNNAFSDCNTNVVKLFTMLERDDGRQLCFYDPGVGTFSAPQALLPVTKFITRALGLAFGFGITENIQDAYTFLMDHWRPGDRVFLFGFSRGAYTARAVAAMVHKIGLLDAGSANLLSYATKMFKYEVRREVSDAFAAAFGKGGHLPVHFVGLWDTVTSVGWAYEPLTLPYVTNNPSVRIVRHAMSIDERRAFFRQNRWGTLVPDQDVKQVWFAGDHCDVGGSWPDAESGLSQIALSWMVREAEASGLLVDQVKKRQLIPSSDTAVSAASLGQPVAPNPLGTVHDLVRKPWWALLEFYPKEVHDATRNFAPRFRINFFRRRRIDAGETLHESVVTKIKADANYRPANVGDVSRHPVES